MASPAPRRRAVVTIGNPNTGKSTLFNALTGMNQRVGNFPGVTVEHLSGTLNLPSGPVSLVDLPGTYSLSAQSPDEMVTVDVLLGRVPEVGRPDVVLLIVDGTNLRRNLFLASQILELGLPVVIAITMADRQAREGVSLDLPQLARLLEAEVIPVVASRGEGLDALHAALDKALCEPHHPGLRISKAVAESAGTLARELNEAGAECAPIEAERALVDEQGYAEHRLLARAGAGIGARLAELRLGLGQGRNLATLEARDRYSWINTVLAEIEQRSARRASWQDTLDRGLNHPLWGSLSFVLAMALVFQSVFAWATPAMDVIDSAMVGLSGLAREALPPGLFCDFLVDGVIAGVGSVVIFLPQILILFAFVILLEDSGYMSRAAFLVDRLMRWCGLSGQSFIPMLSSFACAVPGIMGTRVIADPRDRLATILAAPFMTCSARLPVYALLIGAFVPRQSYLGGVINLQGVVLLAFYLLGLLGAVFTAFLVSKLKRGGPPSRFLMEMPPYRLPSLRSLGLKLLARSRNFLRRAGTLIFGVSLVVWALVSFPRQAGDGPAPRPVAPAMDASYLGQLSKGLAPAFAPLGWDWKVTAAVVASLPAREVVIAVLGTLYSVEATDEAGEARLVERIREARHPDGRPVFSLPMALGLMVFYALCLQCVSTLAVMRRETNGWGWPLASWVYMTALGYLGALACYQVGTRLLT